MRVNKTENVVKSEKLNKSDCQGGTRGYLMDIAVEMDISAKAVPLRGNCSQALGHGLEPAVDW